MYSENTVLTNPEQATPEWLTWALRRSGHLACGQVLRAQADVVSSYTSTIVRLTPAYSSDAPATAPARLFLKLARPDAQQSVVGNEQRHKEVTLHTQLAAQMPHPPLARCYHAAYCSETGAAHLLFEDVSATHFGGDQASMPCRAYWEKAMDAFATWHAFWWDHPLLPQLAETTPDVIARDEVQSIRKHYPRFADFAGERLTQNQRHIFERVLDALPRLLQRVALGKHLTLIHGDANPSNVLLPYDTRRDEALIIDWQLWGVSYATEDLSHLIALYWEKDQREALERPLLMRYHDQLVQHGVGHYDWADCWYDYRLAVIDRVLFMPMWFWTSGAPVAGVWSSLAKAMQAFDDLQCVELVSE
jgi:hypothetical protein